MNTLSGMSFHHIGIACKQIEREVARLRRLHQVVSVSEIVFDELQQAYLCMVEVEDGLRLELIAGPVVESYVAKKMSYYHVCYETTQFDEKLAALQEHGALLVSAARPAILFGGRKVAFLQVSYGLIELLEAEVE